MLPPQRPAQRAENVAELAPEHPVVLGHRTPEQRQGARHAVRVPAPHGRQHLRQPRSRSPSRAKASVGSANHSSPSAHAKRSRAASAK
ncbi:hypothetical protein [Rubrobacter marinus]|uniref:hypothetical protein n=1 Tax=Rubrobacter marinus TaxID=2653852 RepID=UPI0014081325|nr:hypothetical protein [Rubrobacter marinus]